METGGECIDAAGRKAGGWDALLALLHATLPLDGQVLLLSAGASSRSPNAPLLLLYARVFHMSLNRH